MTIDLKSRIFSIGLLYRSIENNTFSDDDIWEESVIFVFAKNEEEAVRKAEKLGKEREVTYKAASGNMLSWKFIQIEKTFEILDFRMEDGIEIFSRFLKNAEVESILTPFED